MSNIAISTDKLSKAYLIGLKNETHDTLTGAISSWLKYPLKNYKTLSRLNTFKRKEEGDDYFWALKDVSFEVKHGEVLGVIGPNGAGKSTLLKILCRITEPTSGSARVYGRVASLLEVGTGFNVELTGRENVYLSGTILGMTKKEIDKKFDEIVDFSGVEKFLDTQAKKYSNGMRIRLAFAISASIETEIIMIDEVLNIGDTDFQRKSIAKMESLAKEGRTVLFVSHNLSAIKAICTRALQLNHGKLIREGEVSKVISVYLSKYVKEYATQNFDLETAPSSEYAKLIKAELKFDETKNDHLIAGDPFEFEFVFFNMMKEEHILDVVFQLKDELDNIVFIGSSLDNNYEKISEGYFKWTCKVPPDIMNQGSYTLHKFYLLKNKTDVIFEQREVLSFEIMYAFDLRIGDVGRKEGIIKPKLNWDLLIGENANK
ncbi:MAG TPA: ABC transporter ATP-binding protein [Ignavibacteria bacterium]|nr:ABC transporter ATP-binding protein [Ignavibacteria bacterium]HQY52568.1 ABC transporter ATP-binding protein [Ignavibacteria bacterium]HRB00182.1 ABC transporter ATP-binding protein [Ignavibacteria bacterium]